MAKWGAYSTNFPGSGTTLPSGWFGYGTRSISGNKLRYPITGSNYAGATRYGDDLLASQILCRVEPGATGVCGIDVYDGGTIRAQIQFNGGTITFKVNGSTLASMAYNATDHAWWQVRESAGTLYLETSPTGAPGTWTTRGSAATPAGMDTADVDLNAGGGSATSEAAFSEFNLPPAGGGSNVTGTISTTLAGITATATGTRKVSGVISTVLPGVTATAQGTRHVAGAIATELPGVSATAIGSGARRGTISTVLSGVTATATGTRGVRGAIATALAGVEATAVAGPRAVAGVISTALAGVVAGATGRRTVHGSITTVLPGVTATARGPAVITPPQRLALSVSARQSLALTATARQRMTIGVGL
jgi:hypothetical protein